MWLNFNKLKRFFNRQKLPVIIVGTDYPSYSLCESLLSKRSPFHPVFFIDDEPWAHRTYILNTQVRYPSELVALTKNRGIKAVFCLDVKVFTDYQQHYAADLQKAGCALLHFKGEITLTELASQVQ